MLHSCFAASILALIHASMSASTQPTARAPILIGRGNCSRATKSYIFERLTKPSLGLNKLSAKYTGGHLLLLSVPIRSVDVPRSFRSCADYSGLVRTRTAWLVLASASAKISTKFSWLPNSSSSSFSSVYVPGMKFWKKRFLSTQIRLTPSKL